MRSSPANASDSCVPIDASWMTGMVSMAVNARYMNRSPIVIVLFRNVAKSLTGVSSVTAFSSVVIGATGIAMMLIGGNSIRNGTMTIGDLVMYLAFTAMITMPVIQLASIGTQLSEAFAGLDRIREIKKMATEDQEDESRAPLPDVRGEVEFDDVTFEYNAGVPVLKHVCFRAPAGSTTALVGVTRS